MSEEEIPVSKHDQLALAIAQGKSVRAWARQNDVPVSTAYRWASERDVRRLVDDWRRRHLDLTLGWMAAHSMWAVQGMKSLGESAESQSVQLSARRALLHDLIKVAEYANLEPRVAALEQDRLAKKKAMAGLPG